MTRLLLIFCISFLTFTGCSKRLGELIFDDSKVELLVKYDYEYKSGHKTNTTQSIYTSISGKISDPIITKTIHIYNDKGLLVKELSYSENKQKPDMKEFIYGENDSLKLQLEINSEGDTVYVAKYISFPDMNRCVFIKNINLKMSDDVDFVSAYENRTNDTFIIKSDYVYNGINCLSCLNYDKYNSLKTQEDFSYDNGKIIKTNEYVFSNGFKMFNKTKFFDYSKDDQIPDFYSLNNRDTIDFEKNEFRDGELICKISSLNNKRYVNIEYYDKGKMIGVVNIDKEMKHKMVWQATYYDNGELKEEKSYGEKLNAR